MLGRPARYSVQPLAMAPWGPSIHLYTANVASHLNMNMIVYRQFIIIYGP